jgi:hypothetical protein
MEPLFSERDRRLIEALEYRPALEPGFDEIKACLVWDDERPVGLTPAGYEMLCDLWIIRGYIHRGIPEERWGIDPASGYFQDVWRRAQADALRWPGFNRMTLGAADRGYLDRSLQTLAGDAGPV